MADQPDIAATVAEPGGTPPDDRVLSAAEEDAAWATPDAEAPAAAGEAGAAPGAPAAPAAEPVSESRRKALEFAATLNPPPPGAPAPDAGAPAEPPAPAAAAPAAAAEPAAPPAAPPAPVTAPRSAEEILNWVQTLPPEQRSTMVVDPSDPENQITFEQYVKDWAPHLSGMREVMRLMGADDARPAPTEIAAMRDQLQQISTTLAAERQLRVLERQYGITDAEELIRSGDFFAWVDQQDPRIKALADSDNAEAVAYAMGVYREEKGLPPASVRQAARGPQPPRDAGLHGSTLRQRGGTSPVESASGEMTDAEADREWRNAKVDD